jgi:hypothetical protein
MDTRTSSNIKLISTSDGVTAAHAQENARVLSPDQILLGDLFNMVSVASPPVEQKRRRESDLSRKRGECGLNDEEEKELRQLSFELDRVPMGSSIDDRAKEATIRNAVEQAKLKIQQLK